MNEVIPLEHLDSAFMDRSVDSQNSRLKCVPDIRIVGIRGWYFHVLCR